MLTRKAVLDRDGWQCRIRGPRCTHWASEVDHIIELANGGSDHPGNIQAACTPCHKAKTQQAAQAARAKRKEEPKHPGLL